MYFYPKGRIMLRMNEIPLKLPVILDSEDKSSPFVNCIRKNYRHLRKWAKRTQTDCFRIYDRELHHFPVAIDFYAEKFCIHFYSKDSDQTDPTQKLVEEVEEALQILFNAEPSSIYWRTRSRSKETRQYEKIGDSKEFFTVYEYGVKFLVNLEDYLDTGLFLDHRESRKLIAEESKGKKVLNLFAYTCAFSVHAACAGAIFTKSVDMSNTYTAWGKENFVLNNLSLKNNPIVRADCLKFLEEEIHSKAIYDLIIIDPPTISRSKKMDQMFDVQVDYKDLIKKSLKMLPNGGKIFFSTNSRRFNFDESLFQECLIKEISYKTVPIDFRNSKIHRSWVLTKI